MNLSPEDQQLLGELCQQHGVNVAKVLLLLKTVHEYEFKDRRTGVYNALKDIFCTDCQGFTSRNRPAGALASDQPQSGAERGVCEVQG